MNELDRYIEKELDRVGRLTSIPLSEAKEEPGKVHDWRNYNWLLDHWDSLTEREKKMIYIDAVDHARNEYWW